MKGKVYQMSEGLNEDGKWIIDDFNDLVNKSVGGFASFCLKGDILKMLYFTKGMPDLVGYTEEEYKKVIGDNVIDIFYEEDRARFWAAALATIESREYINACFRVMHKSGEPVWIHISAGIIDSRDDEYFIKAAFMPMAEENLLYYDIANEATNGIYVISKDDHRLLYINRQLEEVIKKELENELKNEEINKIIGGKCYKVLCDLDKPCEKCVLNSIGPDEYSINRLNRNYTATSHDIVWSGVKASVVYINDITEQKNAMNEVTQVYNNIPGAVFRCKFDDEWTVLSSNDGLYTFLGYSREEFAEMGNKMSSVIYPEDQLIMGDKISAQLKNGNTSVENENRLVCKDGTVKWISIKGQLLVGDDGEKYFYCVFVDISRQKEEEQKANDARKNLNIALEHTKMIYWEYDFQTSKAYVNDATQRLFGTGEVIDDYPESYLKLGFVSEEDIPLYRQNVREIREGAEYRDFVAKVKTLQSDYVWMKVRFTGIKDAEGKPVRAICTAEIISEYKEMEERFKTTLNQNNIESWTYDIPRRTIILTSEASKSGFYGDAIEIHNVPEVHIQDHYCHPDDAEKLCELYRKVNSGQKQAVETIRVWDKNIKDYVFMQCSYTVVFDKDNIPLYAVGSAVNVTEKIEAKRRYEMALEYRKHTQMDNQLLSLHCNISKNRILEVIDNTGENLMERFSYDRESFIKGLSTLIVSQKQKKEFLSMFLNDGIKHNYEIGKSQMIMECGILLRNIYKEYRWVRFQITVAMEPVTKELDGFAIMTDITEIKRQERILAAALQWDYDFVSSVDFVSDTMNIYRINCDESDEEAETGKTYSYIERYKRICSQYVIDSDKELYCKCMNPEYIIEQLKNTSVYEITFHIQKKDGEIRAKRARFTAYEDNRKLAVFSRADVTDMLKEQEQQKNVLSELLEDANKANHAKSDFLSRISHDMRTPLNGILGLTNLMRDKTDWSQIQDDLEQLELSGRYLLNLINDTLDVSKIENGKMTLQPMVCDGKVAIQNILNLLKPNLEAKKINFVVNTANLPFTLLYIDVGRLQQLVMNILSNAIKFTPENGTIKFTMINEKNFENELVDRIIISDNGIGISDEFMPHLFEPFSQENTNRTSKYQGTGLGMTICKQIVDLMGGEINVKSKLGEGTTFDFTVHMPKATNEQIKEWKETSSHKKDISVIKNKRILMCEDHPLNAKIAKRLLEKVDATVEIAENGKIGVEMFENSTIDYYDIILMDIRMPVMDGLEAASKIRDLDREDAKKINIIAMTANALSEDIEACYGAGMNDHISKPVNPQIMYETIAEYI